jgi:hypothetical protein
MSTKQFTAKVFRWLHQVNADAKLAASCTKVAVRLSPDFNEEKGGMAWPSCKTMADDIGKSEGTVINAIRAMQARGHLRVEWGQQGRGHSNHYWMIEKGQQVDLFEDVKPQPVDVFEPQKTSISAPGKPQSTNRKPQLSKRKPQPVEETLSKTHRRIIEGESDSPADRFAKKKTRPTSRPRPKENGGGADAAFERFWAVYPKHVAKDAARRAFAKAIKRVDLETLIAGAQRYAVARRGQEDRYTKHPGTWLNGGCWEDEPPPGAVIDQDGNVVAVEQPSAERNSWEVVAERLIAEHRAENERLRARGLGWLAW